ncbi:hypothetical protein SAMN04488564_1021035 [Lentzea waywayandensis]|uniref:PPE family protein n=1 Tax=Lentzea waywayandensis TaxID=84724 RepID=A0A1I6DMB0_9PSEU|nr:hypothetical protein [Lentzea waywayandensis]SFR06595.1 hypothetical protein SAMN04488564_1021035 [Lentzea waywayandensis]
MSGINWEAYSHEELHRMLWQDADVADVSTVAEEWTRHRAALDAHAEVLREQRTALLDGWAGAAAEEAAARLGALAERVEKISELAVAGQKAAQDSADALAAARAAMPPPPAPGTTMPAFAGLPAVPGLPGAPTPVAPPASPGSLGLPSAPGPFAPPASPASFGLPTASAPFAPPASPGSLGLPSAPGPFALPSAPAPLGLPAAPAPFALPTAPAPFALPTAPAPFALPSAPTMPAGATSGFYFYFGAASADQQKAQAVRAMQTYESSLNGSGRLIDDARGNIPQAAPTPRAAAVAQVKTPSSGGVPWQRLVGGGGGSVATTRGPVIGAATPVSQQLTPGMRAGVVFGQHGGIAATGTLTADPRTAAQNNAMGAPPGAARKDEDERHENQMPTLDHDLFAVTERVSPAVIGEEQ